MRQGIIIVKEYSTRFNTQTMYAPGVANTWAHFKYCSGCDGGKLPIILQQDLTLSLEMRGDVIVDGLG